MQEPGLLGLFRLVDNDDAAADQEQGHNDGNGARAGALAEQQRDQTLRALQSEIAQNYQQMLGYGKEFVQASKKSAASELAYNAVAGKYDRGMVSALDLQTAANNLLQARSERLRARLQYIIKTRLVEYYNGAPLIR